MNPQIVALQTRALEWLITGLIAVLIGVLFWGFKAFLADRRERERNKDKDQKERDEKLEKRDKELQICIDNLKESIWGLRELFVLRKDYDRDMAIFKSRRGVRCPKPDCPWDPPDEDLRRT